MTMTNDNSPPKEFLRDLEVAIDMTRFHQHKRPLRKDGRPSGVFLWKATNDDAAGKRVRAYSGSMRREFADAQERAQREYRCAFEEDGSAESLHSRGERGRKKEMQTRASDGGGDRITLAGHRPELREPDRLGRYIAWKREADAKRELDARLEHAAAARKAKKRGGSS